MPALKTEDPTLDEIKSAIKWNLLQRNIINTFGHFAAFTGAEHSNVMSVMSITKSKIGDLNIQKNKEIEANSNNTKTLYYQKKKGSEKSWIN